MLGFSLTFAPLGWNWQNEMPPSEWGQHMRAHMGYISNTNISTITGLIAPFRPLKLRTTDGKKFDGGRHMNPTLLLRMIGVGPRDASGANVELIISVCPILSGKFTGSTHVVHTDDRAGTICRERVRETDGPRVAVVRSIRLSPITWLTAVCEHLFNLNETALQRLWRCFDPITQSTPYDNEFFTFNVETLEMELTEELMEVAGASSIGLRNAQELQNKQGFGNLDLVLDKRKTVIDTRSMINMGLRGPQDIAKRSGSGASVNTQDTGASVISESKRDDGRFNLFSSLRKNKEKSLAANEQARKAEAAAAELEKQNTAKDQTIQRLLSQLKDAGIETGEHTIAPSTTQQESTSGDIPRNSTVRFSNNPQSQTSDTEKTGARASGPGAQ